MSAMISVDIRQIRRGWRAAQARTFGMLANAVETFFASLTRRAYGVTPSDGSSICQRRSIDFSPFMIT